MDTQNYWHETRGTCGCRRDDTVQPYADPADPADTGADVAEGTCA